MLSLFWSAFFGNMFVSLCFSVPHSIFFDFSSSYIHQFPSSLDPSKFITSVDHVFSPFRSVELSYFDEFIYMNLLFFHVFPSLLSSKLLISVTYFFWGRNFQLFFPCVSPPYFNELFWSKFLVSCFFRPRFGRNYFLFFSHPYFGPNSPFFRCIFLFPAYSHRNFG